MLVNCSAKAITLYTADNLSAGRSVNLQSWSNHYVSLVNLFAYCCHKRNLWFSVPVVSIQIPAVKNVWKMTTSVTEKVTSMNAMTPASRSAVNRSRNSPAVKRRTLKTCKLNEIKNKRKNAYCSWFKFEGLNANIGFCIINDRVVIFSFVICLFSPEITRGGTVFVVVKYCEQFQNYFRHYFGETVDVINKINKGDDIELVLSAFTICEIGNWLIDFSFSSKTHGPHLACPQHTVDVIYFWHYI